MSKSSTAKKKLPDLSTYKFEPSNYFFLDWSVAGGNSTGELVSKVKRKVAKTVSANGAAKRIKA